MSYFDNVTPHAPVHPDNELHADDVQEYHDFLDRESACFEPSKMLPQNGDMFARIARTMKSVVIVAFGNICKCRYLGTNRTISVKLEDLRVY